MQIKAKKLHPGAVLPQRATDGAACFDLVACDDARPHKNDASAQIFPTGLAFEIPTGHAMFIFSRSGHGFNEAARLSNCVGVIDSDYRGEVKVSLRADGMHPVQLFAGDRVAQAVILPVPAVSFVECEELAETERGTGGFGSTGN